MTLRKVQTSAIADNAITTAKIASGAVTAADLNSDVNNVINNVTVDTVFTGDSITIPAGTTAERPVSPDAGMMRYNTTTGLVEQYNSTGWQGIDSPPVISSFSGVINSSSSSTITVNGSNFKSGSVIAIEGSAVGGISRPLVTTYISSTQLTAVTNSASVNYTGDVSYDVKVTNPSGLSAVLSPAGTIDRPPIFITGAGQIASELSVYGSTSPLVSIYAEDPDVNGDPAWGNVALLIAPTSSDSSIADKSTSNTSITNNNVTLSTAVTDPYGGNNKVLYFNGSNAYLNLNSLSSTLFNSSTFTLELWAREEVVQTNALVGINTVPGSNNGGNYLIFRTNEFQTAGYVYTNPTENVWHHYAVVLKNGTYYYYVDGVQLVTANRNGYTNGVTGGIIQSTAHFSIGQEYDGASTGDWFNGYMYDIRLTKGIARYESNFTPTTTKFPTSAEGELTYSITSGSLPSGLSLNSTTGDISGTTTSESADTTYSFTASIQSTNNFSATRSFSIVMKKGIVKDSSLVCYLDGRHGSSNPQSGSTWYDMSGNNNNGTKVGSSSYLSSFSLVLPNAQQTSGYLRTPKFISNGDTTWTLEFWINRTAINTGIDTIFSSGSANNMLFRFDSVSSPNTLDILNDPNATSFSFATGLSTATWKQIVVVGDAGTWRGYVNGSLISSSSLNTSWTSDSSYFYYGQELDAPDGGFQDTQNFRGHYGIIRAYNKALTTAEVLRNFEVDRVRYNI